MKTNNLIFTAILLLFASIFTYIYLPEGKVIEYRLDESSGGRYSSGGLQIRLIVENGFDDYISVPNLSLKEAVILCDSLNKHKIH
jgi:hypothetical protein